VVLERHVRASVVPLSAVVDSGGAKTMFVVSRDGRSVRQVEVQLGWTESGTMVEVLSGLSPDDRVVTLGSHLVQDGQQVEVVDAPVPTSD
jgi:multidrug efflux system membrane fusion protein